MLAVRGERRGKEVETEEPGSDGCVVLSAGDVTQSAIVGVLIGVCPEQGLGLTRDHFVREQRGAVPLVSGRGAHAARVALGCLSVRHCTPYCYGLRCSFRQR